VVEVDRGEKAAGGWQEGLSLVHGVGGGRGRGTATAEGEEARRPGGRIGGWEGRWVGG